MKRQTLDHAVLEELVYDCIRSYVQVWESTLYARELAETIELARPRCAPTREAQDALIKQFTDRAWERLGRAHIAPD